MPDMAVAARPARERCAPRAVQQRIADAFQHAQDHSAACGLRPAVARPRPMQWYTTYRHFRPWTTVMGGMYLVGHLRKPPAAGLMSEHPRIAT